MAIKTPNADLLLAYLLTGTSGNLYLNLFKNDFIPSDTSLLANFVTADFGGYNQKTLVKSSWSSPTTDATGRASTTYSGLTWTVSTDQTIYGLFYIDQASGELVFAERFSAPRHLLDGDTLTIFPKVTLRSQD